jgi:hypothetical protein
MAVFAQDMATVLHPPAVVGQRDGLLDLYDGEMLPQELMAADADPFQLPMFVGLGMGHIQATAAFMDLAGGLLMFLGQHQLLACFMVSISSPFIPTTGLGAVQQIILPNWQQLQLLLYLHIKREAYLPTYLM